jgi:molecular chaperone DnaJ
MSDGLAQDHYDTLQVSANADLDTIHRVYRILAQRFHPDNRDTGSAERFRALSEAYEVLGNPERRA